MYLMSICGIGNLQKRRMIYW